MKLIYLYLHGLSPEIVAFNMAHLKSFLSTLRNFNTKLYGLHKSGSDRDDKIRWRKKLKLMSSQNTKCVAYIAQVDALDVWVLINYES